MSILVRHAMTEAPQTASPDMTAADAAGLMKQLDVGVIPVADGDELKGLVTDRDIVVRVVAERREPMDVALADIITEATVTVSPDSSVSDARRLMAEHRIRRLPVVKSGKLVGVLSLGDVAVADASKRAVGETLEEVSRSESTRRMSDSPPRGTPERVRRARQEHRRSG